MDETKLDRLFADLGMDPSQVVGFLRGETVVYPLRTETKPGIAMIERIGERLRSGVIEINDPGNGRKDFMRFRDRSLAIAIELGVSELELFAAAIINRRIEAMLIRRKFRRLDVTIPDDLGGGTMSMPRTHRHPGHPSIRGLSRWTTSGSTNP